MYNEVLIDCANLALFGLDDAAAGVIVGSIIGGIVNFVGSLINSNTTKKTNEKNIEVTQKENQVARDFEEEMFNKYESIPAQAQQYREAGVNPIQAVSPQSIGHASTSPMPQSQSPQYGNALIESFPAFLNAGTTLRQQRIQRQEEIRTELDNWRQAFENGNAHELYELNKQDIESRVALTRQDKKNREKELDQLDLTYRMAKDAYDSGINPHKDEHDIVVSTLDNNKSLRDLQSATIDQIRSQIDVQKTQIDLNKALEQYNKDKNSREAKELVIESLYKNALIDVADSTVHLNKSSEYKNLNDIKLSNNRDAREAALHTFNKVIARLQARIKFSESQTAAIEAYRTRVKNGQVDNLGEFIDGLGYLFYDLFDIF